MLELKDSSLREELPRDITNQLFDGAMRGQVTLPLVSVVITNFNYKEYVVQAIKSVASQTYPFIECIIVDDCSTDGSYSEIELQLVKLGKKSFRAIKLETNSGQLAAMKAGLELASGVFINFLDSDDLLLPNFVDANVRLHLNPFYPAAVSASDMMQIDGKGQLLAGTYVSHFKERGTEDVPGVKKLLANGVSCFDARVAIGPPRSEGEYYIERAYSGWPVVACSSLLFRRSVLEMIMPTSTEEWRICSDYLLYKLAHAIGGTLVMPSAYSFYRRHESNNHSSDPVYGAYVAPDAVSTVALDIKISQYIEQNAALFSSFLPESFVEELKSRDIDRWVSVLFGE
ncbi:hypothetical protein AMST5_00869 [freshwater sediment metagenome]|jgi:hypothetical protein|uniref:Glycosyltransferase 2-like domain-containing protein n=1 Tax=freshwater sediment metagenome TaxID=556182 RepID=A0AA48M0I1_9ZZZZ